MHSGFYAQGAGGFPPVEFTAYRFTANDRETSHTIDLSDFNPGDMVVFLWVGVVLTTGGYPDALSGWHILCRNGTSANHTLVLCAARVMQPGDPTSITLTTTGAINSAVQCYTVKSGTFLFPPIAEYLQGNSDTSDIPQTAVEAYWGQQADNVFLSFSYIVGTGTSPYPRTDTGFTPITEFSYPLFQHIDTAPSTDSGTSAAAISMSSSHDVIDAASDTPTAITVPAGISGRGVVNVAIRPRGRSDYDAAVKAAGGNAGVALAIYNKIFEWFDCNEIVDIGGTDYLVGAHVGYTPERRRRGTGPFDASIVPAFRESALFLEGSSSIAGEFFATDTGVPTPNRGDYSVMAVVMKVAGSGTATPTFFDYGNKSNGRSVIRLDSYAGLTPATARVRPVATSGTSSTSSMTTAVNKNTTIRGGIWHQAYVEVDEDVSVMGSQVDERPLETQSLPADFSLITAGGLSVGGAGTLTFHTGLWSKTIAWVAMFNGKLTDTERVWMYNNGNFRTYAEVKALAGF